MVLRRSEDTDSQSPPDIRSAPCVWTERDETGETYYNTQPIALCVTRVNQSAETTLMWRAYCHIYAYKGGTIACSWLRTTCIQLATGRQSRDHWELINSLRNSGSDWRCCADTDEPTASLVRGRWIV